MKKIIIVLMFVISGLMASEDWVSKNSHLHSFEFDVYCHKHQAYYIHSMNTRYGLMAPAIVRGKFVRCDVVKTNYHTFQKDENIINFYIIENGGKVYVNP